MSKPLWKVACAAAAEVDGIAAIQPITHEAWQASAEAVVKEYVKTTRESVRQIEDAERALRRPLEAIIREHAVIEAAKAVRVAERLNEPARYFAVHEAKQVFNKAVEALLAEEGEG